MRRVMGLTGIVVGVLAIGAALSLAHEAKTPSEVTIKPDFGPEGDAFKGKVKSEKPSCERGRRVKLLQKIGGQDPTLVGTDRSNSEGRWRVELPNFAPPGEYIAKATRKVKTKPGHRHVCKRAKASYTHTAGPP